MTHTKKMIPVPEWARRLSLTLGGLVLAAAALWPQAGSAQTAAATPTVQLPDFTELAARVSPAVVNIRTTERRGSSASARRWQSPPERLPLAPEHPSIAAGNDNHEHPA